MGVYQIHRVARFLFVHFQSMAVLLYKSFELESFTNILFHYNEHVTSSWNLQLSKEDVLLDTRGKVFVWVGRF